MNINGKILRSLTTRFFVATILLGSVACQGTLTSDLYLGMPQEELIAKYGPPTRTENISGGGEDWYYKCEIPKTTIERESTDIPFDYATGETVTSSSVSKVWSTTFRQLPVSISTDGKVDAIPNGRLVKSKP